MVEVSLGVFFRGFNASKFLLYSCLFISLFFFTLKLDGILKINYAFVFLPLWTCNLIAFLGAIIGSCSFCTKPPSQNEIMLRVDFIAMILTAIEHIFLCSLVVLIFLKLEIDPIFNLNLNLTWTVVFTPLFFLSTISIVIAVWALRHDKPFEFEFFYAINIVQFVFIAFKLDKQIDWSWAVVFIPLWVILSLSTVGVVYALVLSIVLIRSRHFMPSHRRQHVYSAVLHTILVIPTLITLILLTAKLDAINNISSKDNPDDVGFTIVFIPLLVSLFFMILMSLGVGGAPPSGSSNTNVWWFGLRQPLCPFLLEKVPALRTYANVSYKLGSRRRTDSQQNNREERQAVFEEENNESDEVDSSESNRRQDEKNRKVGATNRSGSNFTGQDLEHGLTTTVVRQAINQYKSEYGHLWIGNMDDPD